MNALIVCGLLVTTVGGVMAPFIFGGRMSAIIGAAVAVASVLALASGGS